ncbi:hypothetical protein [Desulfobacter vibrioformis]|uniref:hypothetical protein n=1 Tax=Desulfobacter vibrioformis TaxID=34031 RepID=UPI00055089E7|nr:hypothetical protein [Desulfobacter vibrioformis]
MFENWTLHERIISKIEQNKLQRIIQAAQEIFPCSGVISAIMDKIAEKAAVTKQSGLRSFDHTCCWEKQ